MAQPAHSAQDEPLGALAPVVDLKEFRESRHGPEVNPMLAFKDPNNITKRELRRRLVSFIGREPSAKWVERQMVDPIRPLPFRKMGEYPQSPVLFCWPDVLEWLRARERRVH